MRANAGAVMPAALAACYAAVPLYPSFITLSAVTFPGISLIPRTAALNILLGMALIVAYLFGMIVRAPREPSAIIVPLLAWWGAALLSTVLGFNPRDALVFDAIFGMGIVWHSAIVRYYAAPNVARTMIWAYLLSGTVGSAAAVIMVFARTPAAQYTVGHGRAIGTFILPGELAGYLIVLLPVAYAVFRITAERGLRLVAALTLGLGGLAFALTFSRAGWMGLAAATTFLIGVRSRRFRTGAAAGLGIVALTLLAVFFVFNEHHNPSENYTRLSIWQAAVQIVDRFPLTGVGPFGFSHLYALVRLPDGEPTAFHAHSVYLTILAEMGIVGFAAFAWTGWRFGSVLRDRLRGAPADAAFLALAIAAGLVGTLVQGLIDTVSVVIFGLWLPSMAFALAAARSAILEPKHAV